MSFHRSVNPISVRGTTKEMLWYYCEYFYKIFRSSLNLYLLTSYIKISLPLSIGFKILYKKIRLDIIYPESARTTKYRYKSNRTFEIE